IAARLRGIAFTTPALPGLVKFPGLEWPSQTTLCLGSPEAADDMALAPGDRKAGSTPADVGGDFIPGSPNLFPQPGKAAPVGTWKIVKVNRRGADLEYTLTLRADKTYTARLKMGDEVEETQGTYEYG